MGVCPHVGCLLLLGRVNLDIILLQILPDDHPVVYLGSGFDEQSPKFLNVFQSVWGGHSLIHAYDCPFVVLLHGP